MGQILIAIDSDLITHWLLSDVKKLHTTFFCTTLGPEIDDLGNFFLELQLGFTCSEEKPSDQSY